MKPIALRDAFGQELTNLGRTDPRVVVLDGDLATSTKASMFREVFPDRFYELGNTEQNMMCIAAGMATMGLIPFTSSFACFSVKRALDQVRISVAQPNLPVKICGVYAGIYTGKTGKTHHAIQDIAVMRSMPNMSVIVPADATEMRSIMPAIVNHDGPVYLRVARDEVSPVVPEDYEFQWGKPVTIRNGKDIAIFSTGIMSARALEAAGILADRGVSCRIVHVPCIKPLDSDAVAQIASESRFVVTVEDHSVLGGLGSAIAEIIGERCPRLMRRVGIQDVYAESGTNEALCKKYGLGADRIVDACEELLRSH